MKCKDMKRALRQLQKANFNQYHEIKTLAREINGLLAENNRLKNVNASEIRWNRLLISVRTEVDPLFAYQFDARELCLEVASGNDRVAYKQLLVTPFDRINLDKATFIRGIGERMAAAVLAAEDQRR